jgi:hypothetical protein
LVLAAISMALAAVAIILSPCAEGLLFAPVDAFTHHEPDARYETLFPYYVELCAVSQFRSAELGTGGSPGHAAMYLKGACRDTDAPYPKLRRCVGNVTDPDSPEHGAGVSVNRWLRNVNWVAFAGRGQVFEGNLEPDEVVTRERLQAAAQEAIDAGAFRGVELWPYPGQTPDSQLIDFVTRHSAGTDFALSLARSALCGRVPVEPEMMDEIVHFLNDINRKYATGAADFRWSGYHDNCVHLLRNALAAASIWEPISVRVAKLLQVFHLAVPANEALNLAALGTTGPVDSYPRIFGDDKMRDAMLEFGWLPTRHGALLVSLPVHPNNLLFDTQPRLLVLQSPFTLRTTRRLLKMLDDPRFTELDANLRHFQSIYEEILSRRDQPDDVFAPLRGDRYRRVRRRYFSVIESELREVEHMRAELAAPPKRASSPIRGSATSSSGRLHDLQIGDEAGLPVVVSVGDDLHAPPEVAEADLVRARHEVCGVSDCVGQTLVVRALQGERLRGGVDGRDLARDGEVGLLTGSNLGGDGGGHGESHRQGQGER